MKYHSLIKVLLITVFSIGPSQIFAQKNKEKPLDSALEANSEKWKVKAHKGLFGITKPEFGPYTTLLAEKLDSPVIRKKSKDGSSGDVSISSAGWDWDISKYKTFTLRKFYHMILGKESDTTELQFYVHTISLEKQQTFLGKMLSKNDEDKDATLKHQKNIEGVIFTSNESVPARFFLEDYVSTRHITKDPGEREPITRGYILIKDDSLFTEPIMQTFGNPKNKFFFMEWQRGIFINAANGGHIAALMFDPFYVWIRKDLDSGYQDGIAALFAVIVGTNDL